MCMCVCVCVGRAKSCTAKTTHASLDYCVLSSGRRTMASRLIHTRLVHLQRICKPLRAETNDLHIEREKQEMIG